MENKTWIVVLSHRAYSKLNQLIGKCERYYTWETKKGSYTQISNAMLDEVLEIKGIRKCKQDMKFLKCW
jgi:hypothetical protein